MRDHNTFLREVLYPELRQKRGFLRSAWHYAGHFAIGGIMFLTFGAMLALFGAI